MSIEHNMESDDQYNEGTDSLYTVLNGEISYEFFVTRLIKEMGSLTLNVHHMATGAAGEGGELLDASKKHWIYGKDLDVTNVIEELGDLEFYMAGMRQMLGLSRRDILKANISKLEKRYGDSYSDAAAIARVDKADTRDGLQVIDMSIAAKAPETIEDILGQDILAEAPDWLRAALLDKGIWAKDVLAWQYYSKMNAWVVRVKDQAEMLTFKEPVDLQADLPLDSSALVLVEPAPEQSSQSSASLPESEGQAAQ